MSDTAILYDKQKYFSTQKKSEEMTSLPEQVAIKFEINLPQEKAFHLLSVDMPSWITDVSRIDWDHSQSEFEKEMGKGTKRVCAFGKDKAFENIVDYKFPEYYAYSIDFEASTMKMPIKKHIGIFRAESNGNGGSICCWEQRYIKSFHLMAPVLNLIMRQFVLKKFVKKLIDQHGGRIL